VGLLNTVVGYGLFAGFIALGFSYPLAVLFATILGVLFNFKSIGVLVFRNPDNRLIFRFVGVYTLLYFINVALIALIKILGANDYLAGFLALGPVALFSFLLNKYFVYGVPS
jgi:putative flippase GtrA